MSTLTNLRHSPRLAPLAAVAASAVVTAACYPLVWIPALWVGLLAWAIGTATGRALGARLGTAGTAALIPVAVAFPLFTSVSDITQILLLGVAALGLNLIAGWTGQLSLAHGTIVGLGAYASAIAASDFGVPVLLTIPIATATGAVFGWLLGRLALRFDGAFLAILTMSVALVTPIVLKYFDGVTGGSRGIQVPSADLPDGFDPAVAEYAIVLALTAIAIYVTYSVVSSTVGLSFLAVHDDAIAAEGSGVNQAKAKVSAFTLGSALAGLAGGMYAITVGFINPDSFGLFYGIQFLVMVVVGGLRSIAGSFIGAALIFQLSTRVESLDLGRIGDVPIGLSQQAVYAIVLIAVLLFAPRGAVGVLTSLGAFVAKRVARQRSRHREDNPLKTGTPIPQPEKENA